MVFEVVDTHKQANKQTNKQTNKQVMKKSSGNSSIDECVQVLGLCDL